MPVCYCRVHPRYTLTFHTKMLNKLTVVGCFICLSYDLLSRLWLIKAAMESRPSATILRSGSSRPVDFFLKTLFQPRSNKPTVPLGDQVILNTVIGWFWVYLIRVRAKFYRIVPIREQGCYPWCKL